ncbi:helix-turn-helix domain-containing protein [Streptomyces sp. NPDC050548]|uniref:nSTAND1 domain-containing NTPase n=1 Tax=Streptomyces sp. NPDC050548 TaxID=3365629 RepID=UPI0037A6D799
MDHTGKPTAQGFGAKMRALREARGMSLSELAVAVHYSKSHLSNMENGRKRPQRVLAERLDAALGAEGELTRLCPEPTARPDQLPGPCPYQGLSPFTQTEEHWFFGREDATGSLLAKVQQAVQAGRGTVVLLGASGVGKSSLLRAGLLPRVAERQAGVAAEEAAALTPVVVTPTAQPVEQLAAALAEPLGRSAAEVAEVLTTGRFPDGGERLLLVVDQWEEVFALCADAAERAAYVAAVCQAPFAVLAVRADFYDRCLAHPDLAAALAEGSVPLGAMSRAQLLRAVQRPAELARLRVEPELVRRLLEDLDPTGRGWEPSSLPLLSHALLTTWQHRTGRDLTVQGYEKGGGLRRAIAESAEAVYQELSAPERETARHLLLELVQVGEQGADTRRRARLARLTPGQRAVAEAFTQARLLACEDATVELSHEAVLWAWPRLAGWIDADRAGLRLRQRIADGALAWELAGRGEELLLQGAALALASQWAADHPGPEALPARDRAFLDASAQAAQRGVRRLRRLLVALAGVTALAVLTTVLAGFGLSRTRHETTKARSGQAAAVADRLLATDPERAAALAIAAHRYSPESQAAKEAVAAAAGVPVARRLTGAGGKRLSSLAVSRPVPGAPALLATGTEDGLLTLRRAYADNGLPAARPAWHRRIGRGGTTPVYGLAFSKDGSTLIAGTGDQVRLWRVVHRPQLHLGDGRVLWRAGDDGRGDVRDLRLSPDGTALAAAVRHPTGGYVLVWDCDAHGPHGDSVRSVRLPNPTPEDQVRTQDKQWYGNPYAVSFSASGRLLSAAGSHESSTGRGRGVTAVWRRPADVGVAGFSLHGTMRLKASATEASLSPDGMRLAVSVGDGSLRICPVAGLREPFVCEGTVDAPRLGEYAAGMAYSPDGTLLAEADHNGPVRLRDRRTGRPLLILPHPGSIISLAFSPTGDMLLAGAARGDEVSAWRLPLNTLLGHTMPVLASAMPASGTWLATADRHTVRLWGTSDHESRPVAELRPADHLPTAGEVTALAADREGTRLAVATGNNVVLLYDTSGRARVRYLGAAGRLSSLRPVYSVALSPVGDRLAFGNDEKNVQLWDVPLAPGENRPTPDTRLSLSPADRSHLLSLTFSSDGNRIVGGTELGGLAVWNTRRSATTRRVKSGETPSIPALQVLAAHADGVTAVAFLGTRGSRLATGDQQGTVRLWRWDDAASLPLSPAGDAAALHTGAVTALTATRDGTRAASSSADGSAAVWDTSVGIPHVRYQVNVQDEGLTSARLAPNGDRLWTTDTATARRWPTSYTDAEATLCQTLSDAAVHRRDAHLLPHAGTDPACG